MESDEEDEPVYTTWASKGRKVARRTQQKKKPVEEDPSSSDSEDHWPKWQKDAARDYLEDEEGNFYEEPKARIPQAPVELPQEQQSEKQPTTYYTYHDEDPNDEWMDEGFEQKDCSLEKRVIEAKQRYFRQDWERKAEMYESLALRPKDFWEDNVITPAEFECLEEGEIYQGTPFREAGINSYAD